MSRGIADLHPASFAIVMATGIVSVAAELRGMHYLSLPLVWMNAVFFVALWALTIVRVFFYRS
jgi:tellurite resistance protein TehA-like permease